MNAYTASVFHRANATITGILYIAAAAASIVALKLYEPIQRKKPTNSANCAP